MKFALFEEKVTFFGCKILRGTSTC